MFTRASQNLPRCGLLPKGARFFYGGFAETGDPFSTTEVPNTPQWLIDGKLVAIKAINSECVEDFNASNG